MRSKLPLLFLVLAGACAPKMGPSTCEPISSWAAPASRCTPIVETPAPAPAPEPAPAPAPAPPPAPEPPKAEINNEQIRLREQIQFETDSATILDASKPTLDEVVSIMKAHPELERVRVGGHTDSTSTTDHNQKLSEDRAAAVKDYLVAHGIEGDRLFSKGYGESRPIADNATEEGKAQNRRVEIHIMRKHGEKELTDADTQKGVLKAPKRHK